MDNNRNPLFPYTSGGKNVFYDTDTDTDEDTEPQKVHEPKENPHSRGLEEIRARTRRALEKREEELKNINPEDEESVKAFLQEREVVRNMREKEGTYIEQMSRKLNNLLQDYGYNLIGRIHRGDQGLEKELTETKRQVTILQEQEGTPIEQFRKKLTRLLDERTTQLLTPEQLETERKQLEDIKLREKIADQKLGKQITSLLREMEKQINERLQTESTETMRQELRDQGRLLARYKETAKEGETLEEMLERIKNVTERTLKENKEDMEHKYFSRERREGETNEEYARRLYEQVDNAEQELERMLQRREEAKYEAIIGRARKLLAKHK